MARDTVVLPLGIIKLAFPKGTRSTEGNPSWDEYPNWPPDLFGICAHLLEISGAYHFLTPGIECLGPSTEKPSEFKLSKQKRTSILESARKWRAASGVYYNPEWAQKAWKAIVENDLAISARLTRDKSELPKWWADCYALMAFADEACDGIGGHSGAGGTWLHTTVKAAGFSGAEPAPLPIFDGDRDSSITEGNMSICDLASEDVFCVQPKSVTPSIGCTIRSISHHLSLLPSAGTLMAGWQTTPDMRLATAKTDFNCLYIPFPFVMADDAFTVSGTAKRWRWFNITQSWIPEKPEERSKLIKFFDATLKEAVSKGKKIHALIFPEYSLNWDLHKELVGHIVEQAKLETKSTSADESVYSNIEAIIAGCSQNCQGEKGNFVITTQFFTKKVKGVPVRYITSTIRAKHHRWQLTEEQIIGYNYQSVFSEKDLESVFGPEEEKRRYRDLFWERIPLPGRRVHTHPFRENSVFSTLICEDLARAEPVHKYIRAIGPNIIFVLLMDGCQLEQRWAARYALGLSEDPGSTVVTLTSRALVDRSNLHRSRVVDGAKNSWSVGLSRNPRDKAKEIACLPSSQGVVLSFHSKDKIQQTICGRNELGQVWFLRDNSHQVTISKTEHKDLLLDLSDYIGSF